jgi:cytidine deaminase
MACPLKRRPVLLREDIIAPINVDCRFEPGRPPERDGNSAMVKGPITSQSAERVMAAALTARDRAYAPYSRFPVGAAVLAGGEVFAGCNVENASFGLTICAERVAVFSAVAAGHRRIEAVAVAGGPSGPTAPCGACRQVLHEFGPNMTVILNQGDQPVTMPLTSLLPLAFGPDDVAQPAP